MNGVIKKQSESFVSSNIIKLRKGLLKEMLAISSSFFIVLLFLAIFLPSIMNKAINLFVGWAIFFLLTSNKFIPSQAKILLAKIINIAGSSIFIILFISSLITPPSFLGNIYGFYGEILQRLLNQFFIKALLIFAAFFIFIDLLMLLLRGLRYVAGKYNINPRVEAGIGMAIIFAWLGTLLFMDIWAKISGPNPIDSFFIEITPYFISFFGFSLLYLHAGFLLREIIKMFSASKPKSERL